MATEQARNCITITAGADLSSGQFRAIEAGGVLAGAGELAVGILQGNPDASGKAADVCIGGVSKAVAGAAIAAGAQLASDANGKLVTATTGDYVLGVAKTAAGADTEVFEMIVNISGAVLP